MARKRNNQEQKKPINQPASGEKSFPWIPVVAALIAAVGYIVVALINRSTAIETTLKPIEFTQTAEALHTFVAMTTQAYFPDSTITPTITNTPTFTPEIISTITPTQTLTVENHLVQLIDNYYTCINVSNPETDSDLEKCWNLLSDKPGEFQSNLNKNNYISIWKQYKVTYALYFCSKNLQNFVDAKYYLYNRSDLSVRIGNGNNPLYLEYSFALDENGWRIKGANDSIRSIGSYCESQPRIDKLTLVP